MRLPLLPFVLTAAVAAPASAAEPIVVSLPAERILVEEGGTLVPYTWREYVARVEPLRGREHFVAIEERPPGLSAKARFGFNVALGANVGWAYDRDAEGPFLLVDTDRDGSLTDEHRLRFEARNGALRAELVEHDVPDHATGTRYRVSIEFVLQDPEEPRLVERSRTERRGAVWLAGRAVAVAAQGSSGLYGGPQQAVLFDVDGDGSLDRGERSPERFLAREEVVTLDGRSYRFEVDRFGRSVTLTPTDGAAPRPSLAAGSPAPDFPFTTLDGTTRHLGDYRGQVVLLEFWGSWCPPCRDDLPHLLALHRDLTPRGFAIVGIANDNLPALTAYVDEQRIRWPVALESPLDGRGHLLYRVTGYPSYFLIAPDGRLVEPAEGWPEIRRQILDLLPATPPGPAPS